MFDYDELLLYIVLGVVLLICVGAILFISFAPCHGLHSLSITSHFCVYCGEQLHSYCVKCGEFRGDDGYCASCGAVLVWEVPSNE